MSMMPSSPPINEKENNCHCSDHNPLADAIDNPSNSNFYCLALRVGVFVWFWLIYCAPFYLNFVHDKAKKIAAALCPSATLSALMVADSYLINLLTL